MYEYNDYVKARNIIMSLADKYEKGDIDLSTVDGKLENIRKQNILRSIFDCMYLIDIEADAIKNASKEEGISVPNVSSHEFQMDSEAVEMLGKNKLCLYFFDSMYAGNRKIECYEHLTKAQVINRLNEGLINHRLMEFTLNGNQFKENAEIQEEDFIQCFGIEKRKTIVYS